jgi:hypothetical protein
VSAKFTTPSEACRRIEAGQGDARVASIMGGG